MTEQERERLTDELDELLGPPNGQPLTLTPEQVKRVREIYDALEAVDF